MHNIPHLTESDTRFTRAQLAKLLGVSDETISKMVKDRRLPEPEIIRPVLPSGRQITNKRFEWPVSDLILFWLMEGPDHYLDRLDQKLVDPIRTDYHQYLDDIHNQYLDETTNNNHHHYQQEDLF